MIIKWFLIKYMFNCVILWCFSEDDGKENIGKCKLDILIYWFLYYVFVFSFVWLLKMLWFFKGFLDVNEDIVRFYLKV